jgi:hypothetical protein
MPMSVRPRPVIGMAARQTEPPRDESVVGWFTTLANASERGDTTLGRLAQRRLRALGWSVVKIAPGRIGGGR